MGEFSQAIDDPRQKRSQEKKVEDSQPGNGDRIKGSNQKVGVAVGKKG
jgi:hypothetical protein